MDRDHARVFLKKVRREAEAFLGDLQQYELDLENSDEWVATVKNFAPHVKSYHRGALEGWQRFYLGLDAETVTSGFSVMHIAQNKERSTLQPSVPHSVFEEMKKKMRVGSHIAKLSATGGTAAREIMESRLNDAGAEIVTRGTGGRVGGREEDVMLGKDEEDAQNSEQKEKPPQPKQASRRGTSGQQVLPQYQKPDGDLFAVLEKRRQLYD